MTDDELNELFGRLRNQEHDWSGSLAEDRLRARFCARRGNRRRRIAEYAMKFAASIAIIAGLFLLLFHKRTTKPGNTRDMAQSSKFVLLPYGQNDVPLENPVIVRVQVRASELNGLGIALPPLPSEGRMEADVLIGQDGIARAIRVNERVR